MALTHGEWNAIEEFVNKMLSKVGSPFVQGKVIKSDPVKKVVYLKEFGSTPIPIIGFDYQVKYNHGDTSDLIAAVGIPKTDITSATPVVIMTFPEIEVDGNTQVMVTLTDSSFYPQGRVLVYLYEGAVQVGVMADHEVPTTFALRTMVAHLKLTPSAGKHTYSIRAQTGAGTTSFGYNSTVDGKIEKYVPQRMKVKKTKAYSKDVEILVPQVGDTVLVAQHFGSARLPKCLGVIKSKNYIETVG